MPSLFFQTPPTRAPEYYQYELVGIVVHSGEFWCVAYALACAVS
jgi:hypothetical protein